MNDESHPDPAPAATSGFREAAASCSTRAVRTWALAHGIEVAPTGGLPRFVYELYLAAHGAPAADGRPGA